MLKRISIWTMGGLLAALFCIPAPGLSQVIVPKNNTGKQGGSINLIEVEPKGRDRVRDPLATYRQTITEQDLEAHLEFLASDDLEGRETGERGQKLAAKYIAAQFKRLGLQPGVGSGKDASYFQEFELEKKKFESAQFLIDGKSELAFMEDWVIYAPDEFPAEEELAFVFAGFGIQDEKYNNYEGLSAKGKAVIMLSGEPVDGKGNSLLTGTTELSDWATSWRKKIRTATENNAGAIVMILSEEEYEQFSTNKYIQHRLTHASLGFPDKEKKARTPIVFVRESVGNRLLKGSKSTVKELRKVLVTTDQAPEVNFKKLRYRMKMQMEITPVISENVLGVLPGTRNRDEYVIITAHYDHLGVRDGEVFNGADDDGSGVAAILEIAEAMTEAAQNGYKPLRTVVFMPVSGEEKGLLGSRYYVENPVFPLEKTVCNLNIDMIGRVDEAHKDARKSDYVYVIGSDRLSQDLHDANETAAKNYGKVELDYTFNDEDDPNRFYYRSDHYNFAKNDVPVIFYFTGVHEDYHKSTDTEDKIMYPKMAKITRLIYTVCWEAANRKERFKLDE